MVTLITLSDLVKKEYKIFNHFTAFSFNPEYLLTPSFTPCVRSLACFPWVTWFKRFRGTLGSYYPSLDRWSYLKIVWSISQYNTSTHSTVGSLDHTLHNTTGSLDPTLHNGQPRSHTPQWAALIPHSTTGSLDHTFHNGQPWSNHCWSVFHQDHTVCNHRYMSIRLFQQLPSNISQ